MSRWTFLCAVVLSCPAFAAGCKGERATQTEPASAARKVAVIPKGTTHEFWKSVHAGANKARIDAIVLAPLDDTALVPAVREAKAAPIPVVIIDSDIHWDERASFVATDNFQGGVVAARHLGKLLNGQGKVVVLRYQEGSASTAERERGFLETAHKELPGLELVSTNQYGGATTESAYKTSENLLVQWKALDGVFCPNESTTFGMLRALQDGKRAGQVKFVGFDSSEKLVEALAAGELHGLVVQNPFRMGELGVRAALEALVGKPVEKRIDTGVQLVTRETMNDPEVKALVSPNLAAWLK